MTVWVCATCGVEHPDSAAPPDSCAICSDDRQWVPEEGQLWTTFAELDDAHSFTVTEVEPDLFAIDVTPRFGIGQRAALVRTPAGNLLWEPSGYFSPAMVDTVGRLGPLAAISASHPHLVGASVSWSQAFGGVGVYVNADDRRWVRRPDQAVTFWQDHAEPVPGLTLVQCGGHFAGSAVLHWPAGAGGRGVLLSGDTLTVVADRAVSFMRSYPNYVPLSERLVRKILAAIAPLDYDRIYSGFGTVVRRNAQAVVAASADRYLGWLTDDLRDPDERT